MKKIVIGIGFILFVGLGLVVGYQAGSKQENNKAKPVNRNTENQETISITKEERETLEKIAKLSFNVEKENLKKEDMSETQKSEIARNLVYGQSLTEITGTEMTKEFQKYFGSNQTVIFENIACGMDHGSEEENYYLIFDKDQDKYIYNEKHPGHGGGGITYYGFEMDEVDTEVKDNLYIYNAKILFYGPALDHDVGESNYGNGYKSYQDAKEEKNMLVQIDGNKTYWEQLYDGLPILKMEDIMNDYKNQLDTYSFTFVKEGSNLIFQEYYKK